MENKIDEDIEFNNLLGFYLSYNKQTKKIQDQISIILEEGINIKERVKKYYDLCEKYQREGYDKEKIKKLLFNKK